MISVSSRSEVISRSARQETEVLSSINQKEVLTTDKEGLTPEKEGFTSKKEGLTSEKEGVALEKEDVDPEKEELTPEKEHLPPRDVTCRTETVEVSCCQMGDPEGGKVLRCEQCEETVCTKVTTSTTIPGLFWLVCCISFCCWNPVTYLPCCYRNFKKFHHRCPNCGGVITTNRYPFSKTKMCFLCLAVVIGSMFGSGLLFIGGKYIGIIG